MNYSEKYKDQSEEEKIDRAAGVLLEHAHNQFQQILSDMPKEAVSSMHLELSFDCEFEHCQYRLIIKRIQS